MTEMKLSAMHRGVSSRYFFFVSFLDHHPRHKWRGFLRRAIKNRFGFRISGRRIQFSVFLFSAVCCLLSGASGCARCVLMRSEYYDMTGRAFTAKAEDAEITIYKADEKVDRPWTEIGVVKVMAQPNTSDEALLKELKKRARSAGADALVDMHIKEDVTNKIWFCGRLISTKRNKTAIAKAVVFVDEEKTDDTRTP